MKKDIQENDADTRPDLKHDTMEFSASTDGDDRLDSDSDNYEDDEMTAEELDLLNGAPEEEETAALSAVESARSSDDDILPEEDWTDDLPDDAAENDEADEAIRK